VRVAFRERAPARLAPLQLPFYAAQNLGTSSSASPSIASGENSSVRGTPNKVCWPGKPASRLESQRLAQLRGLIIQMAIDLKIKHVRISIEVVRV